MEVRELESTDVSWKSFLEKNEHLIFHTPQYKAFIENAFGCRYTVFSVLDEEGAVRAILPIVPINSRIFGNKLISSAYIEYGGFAGDEQYVVPILEFIEQKYKPKNNFMEIRGGLEKFDTVLSQHLVKTNLYKRFVLNLHSWSHSSGEVLNSPREQKKGKSFSLPNDITFSSGNVKSIWDNIQESKQKAVKKALKILEVKDVPLADLDILYTIYCKNMRRFGSPSYNKRYFKSFYQHLVDKKMAKVLGAYLNGKLVSALLGFCYRDRVHILISVSDPAYQQHRPNDAVHWEFIRWACQNNYTWFDFGRVREGSGQFEYKQKWGPTLLELPSYFKLWNIKEVPVVDPEQHQWLIKLWQRLPLKVTQLLGMRLRKGLGI